MMTVENKQHNLPHITRRRALWEIPLLTAGLISLACDVWPGQQKPQIKPTLAVSKEAQIGQLNLDIDPAFFSAERNDFSKEFNTGEYQVGVNITEGEKHTVAEFALSKTAGVVDQARIDMTDFNPNRFNRLSSFWKKLKFTKALLNGADKPLFRNPV